MSPVLAEIAEHDENRLTLKYEWRFAELIKTIPGAKPKPGKEMTAEMALSWQGYLAIHTTFAGQLEIGEKLQAWADSKWINQIGPLHQMRDALEADGYESLYPHQRAGVQFLSLAERAFLCDDLGSGKTRTTFSTVRYLFEQGKNPFPVLISCPNSTKIGWAREVEEVWPGLKVNVVMGSAGQRRKLLEEKAHVYIINHEIAKSHSRLAPYGNIGLKRCEKCGGHDPKVSENACQAHVRELNQIDFNTVIIDEVHRIKDPKSQISRALKAATGDARFRYGLSGTPIAATPDDLYSPLNWMYPDVYRSRTKFNERFMDVTYNAWGAEIVIGVKMAMEKEFFGGLDPFLRRMPKEAILKFLPPVIRERRDVEMTGKQQKAYNQMRDKMIAELDGELLYTTSPLTKMTRLLQFASAYAEVEYETIIDKETGEEKEHAKVTLSNPSSKLDAFIDDLEDFGDESVVVFAESRQLIDLLSDRLTKLKIPHGLITGAQNAIERQIHMDDFQAGNTKFILCTIAAGGTGITLTRGSVMAFLQRSWSMIGNLQAEGRAHRIGSEIHERIRIVDYVTAGTVEELVFQAIAEKSRQLQLILRDEALILKAIKGEEIESEEEIIAQLKELNQLQEALVEIADIDNEEVGEDI